NLPCHALVAAHSRYCWIDARQAQRPRHLRYSLMAVGCDGEHRAEAVLPLKVGRRCQIAIDVKRVELDELISIRQAGAVGIAVRHDEVIAALADPHRGSLLHGPAPKHPYCFRLHPLASREPAAASDGDANILVPLGRRLGTPVRSSDWDCFRARSLATPHAR